MFMTEFGRTVHRNGSLVTDHGRGSCLFILLTRRTMAPCFPVGKASGSGC